MGSSEGYKERRLSATGGFPIIVLSVSLNGDTEGAHLISSAPCAYAHGGTADYDWNSGSLRNGSAYLCSLVSVLLTGERQVRTDVGGARTGRKARIDLCY